MRFVCCKIALTVALCLLLHAPTSFAQDAQPAPTPAPTAETPSAVPPVAAASTATSKPPDYLPVCSTEKVNGNCFLNINRRYPISMPTFQMRRDAHVTVYVFHPFAFESLTLDAGAAQAFEGTDQAAGLLNAVTPYGKGAIMGSVEVQCWSISFLASQPVIRQQDGSDDQEWRAHSSGRQNRHDQNRSSARDPLRGGKLPHQPGIRLAWRTQESLLRHAWRRTQFL
jgi:hypothetical protein